MWFRSLIWPFFSTRRLCGRASSDSAGVAAAQNGIAYLPGMLNLAALFSRKDRNSTTADLAMGKTRATKTDATKVWKACKYNSGPPSPPA